MRIVTFAGSNLRPSIYESYDLGLSIEGLRFRAVRRGVVFLKVLRAY